MPIQMRYPDNVVQIEDNNEKSDSWENLDNTKIDDWENLASCYVRGSEKPNIIEFSGFNFNIPDNVRPIHIEIEYDFHKESVPKPIEISFPKFEIFIGEDVYNEKSFLPPKIFPNEQSTVFSIENKGYTNEDFKNLKIQLKFPRNKNDYSSNLYVDYLRVNVLYLIENYSMTTDEDNPYFPYKDRPLELALNEEFRFSVSFRNLNGIGNGKKTVYFEVPEGLEIVDAFFKSKKGSSSGDDSIVDEFDKENNIWYPSVRGKGVSHCRLLIKCNQKGLFKINAFCDAVEATTDFYVHVNDEDFISDNKFDDYLPKWNTELIGTGVDLTNKETAIEVNNVHMDFEMAQEKIDNIKEYCIKWVKREIKPKSHFKALDNVSFKINKGERVGLIGFNGAGKSTMLKILSGVLKPTSGDVYIDGKVAPLLELGAGFDHNYNGRENLYLNGAILGYSKEFLESKYDEIVEFSELGDFMEVPIKNYSSGMIAKLGFSVATIVEPDILILDEILSVGDVRFQKKSNNKLKSMMKTDITVLLVSHSISSVRQICHRAIWLDHGKVVMDGEVDKVCDAYIEAANSASDDQVDGIEFD